MHRKNTASDHHGFGPLIENSAASAPRKAPAIATPRPKALPLIE